VKAKLAFSSFVVYLLEPVSASWRWLGSLAFTEFYIKQLGSLHFFSTISIFIL
jgi:hypothetical protein